MHWYFLTSGKGGGLLFVLVLIFELCCLRTRKDLKASVPLNLQVLVEGLSDFFETLGIGSPPLRPKGKLLYITGERAILSIFVKN